MRCGRDVFFVASPEAPTKAIDLGRKRASNTLWDCSSTVSNLRRGRESVSVRTSSSGLDALGEAPFEDGFGDAVQEHLDGPSRDHPAPSTPQAVLDQRLSAVAQATEHLKG